MASNFRYALLASFMFAVKNNFLPNDARKANLDAHETIFKMSAIDDRGP